MSGGTQYYERRQVQELKEQAEQLKEAIVEPNTVLAMGEIDDADDTDSHIETDEEFKKIFIINDAAITVDFAIDEDSTDAESEIFPIHENEDFEFYLTGTKLHYSTDGSTGTFRYILMA